jgi:transcriptional regulator with XRE-family HTH domain
MASDIAEQLRAAILSSGQSANAIAKATGVPQTTLSRFLRGEDMSIERGAKVAAYLNLTLTSSTPLRRKN